MAKPTEFPEQKMSQPGDEYKMNPQPVQSMNETVSFSNQQAAYIS